MRVFKLLASVWSLKLLYNAPPHKKLATQHRQPVWMLSLASAGATYLHRESLGKLSSLGHSSEMLS